MKIILRLAFHILLLALFSTAIAFAQDWRAVQIVPGGWANVDFNDVCFADGRGWAVGKGGDIISYNGLRWHKQVSGVQTDLHGVYFENANEGWAVGDNGVILRTEDGGNIWKRQAKGVHLYDVYFTDNKHGWAVGARGNIFRTEDGGFIWTQMPIHEKYGVYDLLAVHFYNLSNGWVVGERGIILNWNGRAWEEQQSNTNENLYGIYFTSTTDGWIVGNRGVILYTNNGWTWNSGKSRAPANTLDFRSVCFPRNQDQYGWIVGENGIIIYTPNYGRDWLSQTGPVNHNLNSVYAMSPNEIWAVGNEGYIIRTTNRGDSWNIFLPPPYGNLWDVSFRSNWSTEGVHSIDGWIVGDDGIILRSDDAGESWYEYQSPVRKNLYSICMLGRNYGWAAGEGGTIIRIMDDVWNLEQPITGTRLRGVHFSFTDFINNGWAVGDGGTILHWDDTSRAWVQQVSGVTTNLYGVYSIDKTEGWAVGDLGTILHTTNDGITWTKVEAKALGSKSTAPLRGVYFPSGDTGWIVGDGGVVLRWQDGELKAQDSRTLRDLYDLDFVNKSKGWSVGANGVSIVTSNSGALWEPVPVTAPVGNLYGVDFADWSMGIAVGENGAILKFTGIASPVRLELTSPRDNVTTLTPTFVWTSNKPELGHTIYIDDDSVPFQDWMYAVPVSGSSTSYTLNTPLAPGTYYWGIEIADGTRSAVVKFTVWPPTAVTLISPSGYISEASPTFQWNCNNKDLESITYTLFVDSDNWPYDAVGTSVGRNLSHKLPGMSDGQYSWGVRTSDGVNSSVMKFTIDLSEPTGTVVAADGVSFTNSPLVVLRLVANDLLSTGDKGSGVTQMQFSNDNKDWSDPEPFAEVKNWDLSLYGGGAQDGLKTVYVRYKDALGHWMTTPAKDEIILDRVPPTGIISINDGAEVTGPTGVKLSLLASDELSNMEAGGQIRLSNDGNTWSEPLPYVKSRGWDFKVYGGNENEGLKTVYVKFGDAAGNWMTQSVSDDIRLDKTGPTGTIVINDGAGFTNSLTVNLTLAASDESGVQFMQFTNGGGIWSPQEIYSTKKDNWDLSQYGGSSVPGEKKVYVLFVDSVGNTSAQAASDGIYFKSQVSASIQIFSPKVTGKIKNNDSIRVDGKSEPDLAEVRFDVLDENGNPVSMDLAGVKYDTKTGLITGSFNVGIVTAKSIKFRLRVKDALNNQAEVNSGMLTVDNDPPGDVSVTIDQGKLINSPYIDLTISATGALEMYLDGDVGSAAGIPKPGWISYVKSLKVELTAGDGVKTVSIKFRDDIGNESAVASDQTVLDTTPPVGTIVINNGDDLTKDFVVSLMLSVIDASGIKAYQLSSDGSKWSGVSPWPATADTSLKVDEWDLLLEKYGGDSTEGMRTVYVMYEDKAGNLSEPFSDDILVSVKTPCISLVPVENNQQTMEPVTVTAVIKPSGKPIIEANLYYGRRNSRKYTVVAMTRLPGAGDYYKAEIPGSEVVPPGVDYYVSATDGVWTVTRPEKDAPVNPWSFSVVDTKPPAIEHEPVVKAPVKSSSKIAAKVTDKVGVKSVWLYYKPASGKSFTRLDMVVTAGSDIYSASVPALDGVGVVDYYIEAVDSSSNFGTAPAGGPNRPYTITFVDAEPPVIVHTKIPDGQEAGKPVSIVATITDNIGVKEALLKYKVTGKTEYVEVKMTRVDAYYRAEIPGYEVMPGKTEYIVAASDNSPQPNKAEVSNSFTVIDTTPPFIELAYVPAQVEVFNSISIEAKVTDNVKVEAVILYYKGVEVPQLMTFNAIDMNGVGGKYSAIIPGQNRAGEVKFYIYARDSQGISSTEPGADPQNKPRRIPVLDTSRPVIEHSPVLGTQEAGRDVTITATVKDNVGVANASLHYRTAGQMAFKTSSMVETGKKTIYTGSIPGSAVLMPGVEYYIKAMDDSNNVTTHPDVKPDSLPHSFRVADTMPPEIVFEPSEFERILITNPIVISVKVTDLTGIKEVMLFYSASSIQYNSQAFKYTGEDRFSATIPSPLSKSKIYYYIRAEDNSGNKTTSPKENPEKQPYSITVEDPFPPLPPARLTASSVPGGRIILTWELSKSPDAYKYNIYTDKGSGNVDYSTIYDSVTMTTNTWESPALGDGMYKFVVRAVDASGNEEGNTIVVWATADATKPDPVTNLVAIIRPGGRIQLKWTLSLSRDSAVYNIYYDNAQADINYTSPLARVNDPLSSWTSDPLKDGIVYRFAVRCQDHAGNEEGNNNFVSARADATPPGNVTNLSSTTHKVNVWSNQPVITVNWSPAEDAGTGLAGYSVVWDEYQTTLPDEIMDIELISSIQHPASGTQYFHIRPVDKAGNWSATASHLGPFLIDTQPPLPPTGLRVSAQSGGRIKLDWQASASADVVKYSIYSDNGTGRGIDYSRPLAQTSTLTWTSAALEDGRAYQFSVRAEDRAGNEEKNIQGVSGIADNRAPTITHTPVAGMLEQDKASLSINATVTDSSGIDGVKLYYRKHGDPSYEDVEMAVKPNTNLYKGEIPASAFSPAGVDYYISATDMAGNLAKNPVMTIEVVSTLKITIDPSSGNEVLIGDSLSIYLPAGAVSSAAVLTITVPSSIPKPQAGLGEEHILTREINLNAELKKSITITLTYSDEKVIGVDESKLAIYLWDGKRWNFLANADPQTNQAHITYMRLGIFSIIGDYDPPVVENMQPSKYAEPGSSITAKVYDNGSGVDPKSATVLINGSPIAVPSTALKDDSLSLALPDNLGIGHYSLQVAVRDNVGNQTVATSEFQIKKELDFYCYPNPFHPTRGVHFAYKLTENVKSVTIRVFGMDGKLVRKIDGTTLVGKRNDVFWNCIDEAGDLVLNGVYICHIEEAGSRKAAPKPIKIAAWE